MARKPSIDNCGRGYSDNSSNDTGPGVSNFGLCTILCTTIRARYCEDLR